MRKKSIVAIIAVVIVVVALLVFFIVPMATPNTIAVQFYDSTGNKVGAPQKSGLLNGATVLVGGVEVESFDITVTWSSNNPDVDAVDWYINIKVYYYPDDVFPPNPNVVFDDLCWAAVGDGPSGTLTSGRYIIEEYAKTGVPENTAFYIQFYGYYKYAALGVGFVHEADFGAVEIACYHSEYTYTATLDIGW